ncbi:hypothetical protein C8034_v000787 [Colletotrichum sidae]|uniref:Uncharacterized protein n=1 Tax=Colletotrichum sidae TaxID=1347389 RepID=A0A4R8TM04_9PEZI|nr:hypothetical protein C8034_v000787 [Colletotrichum sidae]
MPEAYRARRAKGWLVSRGGGSKQWPESRQSWKCRSASALDVSAWLPPQAWRLYILSDCSALYIKHNYQRT